MATVFVDGDTATLGNTFAVNGAATDPTTISLAVTSPAGTTTTYTYAAAQITKVSTGVYSKNITVTPGLWVGVWTGTGTAADVAAFGFFVYDDADYTKLYVTPDELKSALGITDTGDDYEITAACVAACRSVDDHCHQRFWQDPTVVARYFTAGNAYRLWVDQPISTSTGLIVETDDNDDGTFETTWTIDTDFRLEPLNAAADSRPWYSLCSLDTKAFPGANRGVKVTARWGWAACPYPVRLASRMMAHRLFKRKGSPTGVEGFNEFGPVRITRVEDPDIVNLLAPYVRADALVG